MGAVRRKEVRVSRKRGGLGWAEPRCPVEGGVASAGPLAPHLAHGALSVGEPLPAPAGTFTARLVAVDDAGRAWIRWQDEPEGPSSAGEPSPHPARTQPARSTVALQSALVGREVLVCSAGRAAEPIIIGVLVEPAEAVREPTLDLIVERRRIVLTASTEVVLRCGEGSLTLTADGKVTLQGLDVISSATRTQRIRGGAVRIN